MGRFDKDCLGSRMKKYEETFKNRLVPKMPFIIRIDGKAFHTFTKGMVKPFDEILVRCMQRTMISLCEELQGCIFGYTQSDEITLVFVLQDIVKSQALFDYEVQKIVSVSASKATLYFNKYFYEETLYESNYYNKVFKAEFDSRVFSIPEFEILNNLIWRQQDAVRNSINSLGFSVFSHKKMQNKKTNEIQDMLMEKGINWNDLSIHLKRGSCCYKKLNEQGRRKFIIDKEMPILTTPEGRKWFDNILRNEKEGDN